MAARPPRLRARVGRPHRPRGRGGDGPRAQARRGDPDQPLLRRPPVVGRAVRPRARSSTPRPGSTSRRCGPGTAGGTAAGSTAASTGSPGSWPVRLADVGSLGMSGATATMDACEAFKAAAPRRLQRDGATIDPRVRGESYKVDVYEDAIGRAFEHVAVSSTLKASTVAMARRPEPDGGDDLARARIKRERDQAALRFAKDRDLGQARGDDGPPRRRGRSSGGPPVTHPDGRRGTRLPGVAAGPVGEDLGRRAPRDRRGRVRADRRPGGDRLHVHADRPREGAGLGRGLRSRRRPRRKKVDLVGARGFEPPTSSSRTMRATKLRHAPTESARSRAGR